MSVMARGSVNGAIKAGETWNSHSVSVNRLIRLSILRLAFFPSIEHGRGNHPHVWPRPPLTASATPPIRLARYRDHETLRETGGDPLLPKVRNLHNLRTEFQSQGCNLPPPRQA